MRDVELMTDFFEYKHEIEKKAFENVDTKVNASGKKWTPVKNSNL